MDYPEEPGVIPMVLKRRWQEEAEEKVLGDRNRAWSNAHSIWRKDHKSRRADGQWKPEKARN